MTEIPAEIATPPRVERRFYKLSVRIRYKGYDLRRVDRKIAGFAVRVSWDVYRGEVLIKANFATQEMAKHYIDLVQGGEEGEEG